MPFARREVAGSNPVAPIFQESVCTGSFIFHYVVLETISLPEYPNSAPAAFLRREVAGSNPVAPIFQESVCTGSFIFHYVVLETISLPEYPNSAPAAFLLPLLPLFHHVSINLPTAFASILCKTKILSHTPHIRHRILCKHI